MNENTDNSSMDMNECRERRRRRILMRQASLSRPLFTPSPTFGDPIDLSLNLHSTRPINLTHPYSSSSSSYGKQKQAMSYPVPQIEYPLPVYGMLSLPGRSDDMEDNVSVVLNLCSPSFNRRKPLHYFGLFDGHGGTQVSELCKDTMHMIMAEELMNMEATYINDINNRRSRKGKEIHVELEDMVWRLAIQKCFERMDEAAMSFCFCGNSVDRCNCHPIERSLCGSTAVVAMLTPEFLVVANCGDSRAVLCRAGKCEPMSYDHKPDRADENARILAAGGRVYSSGGPKVEGILAVSRAIGDRLLKRLIISEPEIRFMKRHPEDECLILASDGLWDVVSSDLACEVARMSLREGVPDVYLGENICQPMINTDETELSYPSSSAAAAAVLTRLALSRNSGDNISVIVVDLRG